METDPSSSLEDSAEIIRYARLILHQAGVGERLPTPVDDIVACAELVVSQDVVLSEEHVDFFTHSLGILRAALNKVVGLVDLRENVIYLDTTVLPQKRAFIKLHETGHKLLPWQRQAYLYLDDENTLDPDISALFERQANYFAAEVLFQAGRFDGEARDLPLALKSPMALAKRYGASAHASIRRYVERNKHACAVLIIERLPELDDQGPRLRVKRVIQSELFRQRFGDLSWPQYLSLDWPFTGPILRRCRFLEDGEVSLNDAEGQLMDCEYHLFDNSYNIFVFIRPLDERVRSRSKIVIVR